MKKKSVFLSIILVVIFSISFSYSLVFGVNAFFGGEAIVNFKLSNNIYPDSLYLKNTMLAFKSNKDLSEYNLHSNCSIYSNLISKKTNVYIYELKFLDNKCIQKYFYFENKSGEKTEKVYYNIISEYKLYSEFIDYKTNKLKKIEKLLNKKRLSLLDYREYNKNGSISYYNFLKKNRLLNEIIYNRNIIISILNGRNNKYSIPVIGKSLPTNTIKIPNTSRLYRANYTDGIHHGWDFDTDFGEQVNAIDDGIIVRVVSGFKYADLLNITRGNNLTNEEKLKNLDTLRGNQIWLKTMKGDIAFYSHLNDVFTNIKEGTIVRRGQPIGTVGISGVPDKNYTDYHLHIAIHKNPYNEKMVGKYDLDDYMNWDRYFKGETSEHIINNQLNIFE